MILKQNKVCFLTLFEIAGLGVVLVQGAPDKSLHPLPVLAAQVDGGDLDSESPGVLVEGQLSRLVQQVSTPGHQQ